LAWVEKCHHGWLDQNFDPSLLTNKLWLVLMGKNKKISKWLTQKNNVFQNRQFMKFLQKNIENRRF
jgi:hypothetical protein